MDDPLQFAQLGLEGGFGLLSFLQLLLERLPLALGGLELLDDFGLELVLGVVGLAVPALELFEVMLAADKFLAEFLVLGSQLRDLLVGLLPDLLDVLEDGLQLAVGHRLAVVGVGLGGGERRAVLLGLRGLGYLGRRAAVVPLPGVRLSLAHYIML